MDQTQSVDISTRRRAEEMKESQGKIDGLRSDMLRLDGTPFHQNNNTNNKVRLSFFESVIVVSYIHSMHCNTISNFVQKSNFTRHAFISFQSACAYAIDTATSKLT